MKLRTAVPLLALALLLPAVLPAARAAGGKAEVLARIEALLAEGDLDRAKEMIDFFLGKNPGDADLLVLRDRWRVIAGDLAGLLEAPEGREATRAAAWRVVAATLPGNPEEWEALLHAGDADRTKALLGAAREAGSPEDRRTAEALLARLAGPGDEGARDVPPDRVLAALRSDDPEQVLWGLDLAERLKIAEAKADAKRILGRAETPDAKYAAAGVLLALGETNVREELLRALRSGRPVDAVEAGKVLFRHPPAGARPIRALLETIEADEEIGRAKPALVALGFAALAERKEPGARELLEGRLGDADFRVDAARALGVLGDPAAVPALLTYLRAPPPAEEEATAGGLGFLGGHDHDHGGTSAVAAAEALRPALVGALAILRLTAAPK